MATKEHKHFSTTNAMRSAATITVFVLVIYSVNGEDLVTLDGKTYTNITAITKYPSAIYFSYNNDRKYAAITNLSEEFRLKHDIKIVTNVPTEVPKQTQQPLMNPTDLFLWQNKESNLSECDSQNPDLLSTNSTHKSWQICLHGNQIVLTSYLEDRSFETISRSSMYFYIGQEDFVTNVFYKFIDWANTAKNNNAESFDKEIGHFQDANDFLSQTHTYTFHWDYGQACLFDSTASGVINEDDVIQFQELVKRLPTIKEKLVEKIRNQAKQQSLFQ